MLSRLQLLWQHGVASRGSWFQVCPEEPELTISFSKSYQVYIFAQVLGGIVGAGLVYAQYIHAIDIFEGGRHIRTPATAGLFSSFAVRCLTTAIIQIVYSPNTARLPDECIMLLFRVPRCRDPRLYDYGCH